MEEMTIRGKKQIIEVTITDAKEISDNTISCTRLDVGVHRLPANTKRFIVIRIIGLKVRKDRSLVFVRRCRERCRWNELHRPGVGAGGKDTVRCKLQVQVLLLQESIHQTDNLNNQ